MVSFPTQVGWAPPTIWALAVCCAAAHAQPPKFTYIKKETRQASRDATLAQYTPQLQWGRWMEIGPFDDTGFAKHHVVYPPELGVDLQARYPGKNSTPVSWRSLEPEADGGAAGSGEGAGWPVIDMKRYGADDLHDYSIAYLYRDVMSDKWDPLESTCRHASLSIL